MDNKTMLGNVLLMLCFDFVVMMGYNINDSDVSVTAQSIGCYGKCPDCCINCPSYIAVNSYKYLQKEPGLHMVVISKDTTGHVINNATFNNTKLKAFLDFLEAIPPYSIIILTIHKQCDASISGCFELLKNHSKLKFTKNQHLKSAIDYESSIIITCQSDCPLGSHSKVLPLFIYERPGDHGFIRANITLNIGKNDISTVETKINEEEEDSEQNVLITTLAISIASIVVLIILIAMMVCCRKSVKSKISVKENVSSINSKSSSLSNSKIQQEFENITKEIIKLNTLNQEELDTISFKADIVRKSMSSIPDTRMLSPDYIYENVFKKDIEMSLDLDSCSSKSISTACRMDSGEYLTPVDYIISNDNAVYKHRANGFSFDQDTTNGTECANTTTNYVDSHEVSNKYEHSANVFSFDLDVVDAILNITETGTNAKTPLPPPPTTTTTTRVSVLVAESNDAIIMTKEPEDGYWFSPSTSHKIFHNPKLVNKTIHLSKSTYDEDDPEERFAEYCKIHFDGPVYKKPSDVLRHDPPEYNPIAVSKISLGGNCVDGTNVKYADPNTGNDVALVDDGYEQLNDFNKEKYMPLYDSVKRV